MELDSERRLYSELNEAEKAVIQMALPRGSITREAVLENLADNFTKTSLKQAFSRLCEENRLFRIGNRSKHIIIERDLFS